VTLLFLILLINAFFIFIMYRRDAKEVFTVRIDQERVYLLLNDDIYFSFKRDRDNSITKKNLYTVLKQYSDELSTHCDRVNIFDKYNIVAKDEVENIIFHK